MTGCECKQKWCAQCNPARGFVEGVPVAEVVQKSASKAAKEFDPAVIAVIEKRINDLMRRSPAEQIKALDSIAGNAALLTGWICPLCKCGVSPKIEVCPCSAMTR